MTRLITISTLALSALGCADDKGAADPVHATCHALDEREVTDRLDNLVSNDLDAFALDGHCLEATFNQASGNVWSAQFAPTSGDDAGPPFHIQMYFLPPETDTLMEVHEPDDLVKAKCQDVPENKVCAHVDHNADDPGVDDVDLRVLTGSLDMRIVDTSKATTTYEGDLVWTIWGVNTDRAKAEAAEPSLKLEGTLHLTVID